MSNEMTIELKLLSNLLLENNFSAYKNIFLAVRTSLEADGELSQMKAAMRTKVMKLLEGSHRTSRSKCLKSPQEVLIINELIREYLDWMGYKYTSSVLVSGRVF
jgi:lisH domain-containing protein FOPNL